MQKRIVTLLLLLITNIIATYAQVPSKITDDKLFGKDCFYIKVMPDASLIKGVLVLVPGLGEHPYSVTVQTTIVQEAIKNGLAVVMVSLSPENDKSMITGEAMERFGNMIKHFYLLNKIDFKIPLFVGGFSIGGTTVCFANTGHLMYN